MVHQFGANFIWTKILSGNVRVSLGSSEENTLKKSKINNFQVDLEVEINLLG
jgi:hypothetical protein